MQGRLGISGKLLLALVVATLVLTAACLGLLRHAMQENLEAVGQQTAESVSGQIRTLRAFYTAEIASRAKKAGMSLGYDFATRDGVLPLPATLVHVLGERIASDHPGMKLRLYSAHPFPHRAQGEHYDAFEKEALAALVADPSHSFHRIEPVDGRLSIRLASADVMQEGCVSCHNAHPESPKRDWKVGDVRGAVEVVVPLDTVEAQLTRASRQLATMLVAGLIVFGVAMVLLLRRIVILPLQEIQRSSDAVAAGDLTVRPVVQGDDELAAAASALDRAVGVMAGTVSEITTHAHGVAAAAEEFSAVSKQTSHSTGEVASQAGAMSAASHQVAQNLQAVAASTDEMGTSIQEIARNAQEAARIVGDAVLVAEAANGAVAKLGDSSTEIGNVVKMIRSIAAQTNLLALNATIEAARAGDAGRGFAVVANEVKELAKETSGATEDIGRRIEAIQQDTGAAVDAIQRIGEAIDQVSRISSSIAGAVEEQNATTNEMSRGVAEAAHAAREIATSVASMARSIQSEQSSAADLDRASAELAAMASTLEGLTRRFRIGSDAARR